MTRISRRLGATLLLGSVAAALPGVAVHGSAEPPPLASGHAEVVAQGIVNFSDGTFHWQVADGSLAASTAPTAVPQSVTFVLADSGVVDVTAGGHTYRLGAGEAAHLPAFSEAVLATPSATANYWTMSIANVEQTGGAGATGGSFTLGAALRDVDVLRDVLATDESLTVPDQDVATLVLVTGGAVAVTSDSGEATDLAAGEATTIDDQLTITNDGDDPAIVVAAVIGSIVPPAEQGPLTTSAPPPPNTNEPTSESSNPTTTGETTTSTTMPTDSDGDGLSDEAEIGTYGTDPNNPDTEGDHVMDGDEVNVYGTDPNDNDSDNDFSTDGDEVNILGTDPTNPDTDGDGLIDSNEGPNGADPNNADTDGDGFNDGTEVSSGTNPADASSHP
jgi:Bacterial TSP3 repeat